VQSQTTPDIFFGKAARFSFGPLNGKAVTYGSALKTRLENPTLITQAWCAEPNIITSQQARTNTK